MPGYDAFRYDRLGDATAYNGQGYNGLGYNTPAYGIAARPDSWVRTLRAAINSRLRNNPGVAAIVGARVRPGVRAEKDPLPGLTYLVINAPRGHHLGGASGQAIARVQFDAWALTAAEAERVALALAAMWDGYQGRVGDVVIQRAWQDDERDAPPAALQEGSDAKGYRVSSDYFIKHLVAVPAF